MEIDKITIFLKLKKGGNMTCKKNRLMRDGKRVPIRQKVIVRKAIRDIKKSYPK
jgi:hypothetical protein